MRRTLHPDTHPLTAEYQDNILRHAREVRETLAFQIHDDNPDAPKQAPEANNQTPIAYHCRENDNQVLPPGRRGRRENLYPQGTPRIRGGR